MTEIKLKLDLSVERNAGLYYEEAKKVRKKVEGAKEALEESHAALEKLEKQAQEEEKKIVKKQALKQEWYHKFRWFITSDSFFVIGGRDATTNEIIVKKHCQKDDFVFHTDMAGSPFFVIKAEGKKISDAAIKEAADATISYSKAWQKGLTTTPVFYVKPEQVTKEAKSGEYLVKGAFVIKGKVNYVENKVNLALGMYKDGHIMGGPVEAVSKHCASFVRIRQGNEKTSAIAKKIQKKLGGDLDEIIRSIPAGGVELE